MGDTLVVPEALLLIITVGATLSNIRVRLVEIVFPLAAASVATFAATLTVTVPGPVGVMFAV